MSHIMPDRVADLIPTTTGASLPPLAYAHPAAHDVSLTAPSKFRPIATEGWVKPKSGTGLWTAPITRATAEGLPMDTAWLEFCRDEMGDPEGRYSHLTEILPAADARVVYIDTQEHLSAIVDAHPACLPIPSLRERLHPDWAALAQNWDAVYLTDAGQWATRLPRTGPSLYTWDVASVLWLQPAYTVGRTVAAAEHRTEVAR